MLPQYLDQLDKERQEVFKKLKIFSPSYILAGGTAIMLQTGHRVSYDFDLFYQNDRLPMSLLLNKLKKAFNDQWKVTSQTHEIYSIKFQDQVDITFVAYPYKILRKPIITSSVSLFHLDDLAANKAYTVGRRNTWRDYVDLFFLLKWKIYSLGEIIRLSEEKYGGEFSEKLFLEQLCFFKDINIVKTVFLKDTYSDSEIKLFLEKEVFSYVKERL